MTVFCPNWFTHRLCFLVCMGVFVIVRLCVCGLRFKKLVGSEQSFNVTVLDGLALRTLLQLERDKVL